MGTVDSVARLLALSAGNGSGGGEASNYNDLANKPQINGTTLTGNKTLDELGITADSLNVYTKEETTNAINDATSGKADKTALGDLSNLVTDDKSSAVAAINEIKEKGTKASNIDDMTITENENGEIQAVGVLNENGKETSVKIWTGTKEEYDAIDEKDDTTLYNITDDYEEPEVISNKVTTIDGNSTDTQYPSAKAVYDIIQNSFDGDAALDNIVPKQTATDSIINVNDALKYKTFDFKVDGAYKQTTSDGSNLLNIDYSTNPILGEKGDIQASLNDDYSFTITGQRDNTEYSNIYFNLLTDLNIKQGVQYYTHDLFLVLLDSELNWIKNQSGNFIADGNYIVKRFYWATNKTGSINEIIRPYFGTVPYDESNYYKYTGGIASPNANYPQDITTLSFDKIMKASQNLFDVNDVNQVTNNEKITTTVDKDDFIHVDIDNTGFSSETFANYWTNTSNKLVPNHDYLAVVEIKEYSGKGYNAFVGTEISTQFKSGLSDWNKKSGVITGIVTTKDSFENISTMLRTFIQCPANDKVSITYRISILADLTVTPENFVYKPYQAIDYSINLQGNEMVSLPNGVKDELTIDKEGNVSLIKRIGKKIINEADLNGINDTWFTLIDYLRLNKPNDYIGYNKVTLSNSYNNTLLNKFYRSPKETPRETYDDVYSIIEYQSTSNFALTIPKGTTLEQAREMTAGTIMYYELAEPQTISLGKLSDIITTEQGSNTFAINSNIDTQISTTYALDLKKYIDNKISTVSQAVIEQE